ncbi:MAG: BrnT family toxin [bacterium]|nr:BrnT family toxin [bacterium]
MVAFGEMGPHVVAVVYVWCGKRRRLVSARKATKAETSAFYEVIYGKE